MKECNPAPAPNCNHEAGMQIHGKLRNDINAGNAVLFLGAGVGIAAGLFGAEALAQHLYVKAGLAKLAPRAKDLSKLVAALDSEPQFTRSWVNDELIRYYNDRERYTNLTIIQRLLNAARWKAIFTTNFDVTIEMAYSKCGVLPGSRRLVSIADAKEEGLISGSLPNQLKYFKLHGCVDAMEKTPGRRIPLVLTQRDFMESVARNAPFWKELRDNAYGSTVIFVGYNVSRTENIHVLGSLYDVYVTATQSIHDTFRPFAVLPNISEEQKDSLQELDINLLHGDLDAFVTAVENDAPQTGTDVTIPEENANIDYHYRGGEANFTQPEVNEFESQFNFYHSGFAASHQERFETLSDSERADAWKGSPSLTFLYSGRPIQRTCFSDAYNLLKSEATQVSRSGISRTLFVIGERAAGKSVLAHKLAEAYYVDTKNHVLLLNPMASFIETRPEGKEANISGWNARLINKFLSLNSRREGNNENLDVPILLADHCAHKQVAIDNLMKLLENHGKKVLVVLTVNPEEIDSTDARVETRTQVRLFQSHPSAKITVPHEIDDSEIEAMFNRVAEDCPRVKAERDRLIYASKASGQANRDLLLTLYLWFDKNYRRLEEIIAEEAEKLRAHPKLMELYFAIAVFHQYNLSPQINLCLRACGISIKEYDQLRADPFFRTFIKLSDAAQYREVDGFTRHPDFTRKLLKQVEVERDEQTLRMCKVLSACEQRDLQFVRAFFDYIYELGVGFSVADVTSLKEATEKQELYKRDVILNHRFASFLIREKVDLDRARYYLDLADGESLTRNPTITHSLGALNYAKFRETLDSDRAAALRFYGEAKRYFRISRGAKSIPDEYGYVTDSDMTRCLLDNTPHHETQQRAELEGENQALIFEAMQSVPREGQNYITNRLQHLRSFSELEQSTQDVLLKSIYSGESSPGLLRYYAESLLANPKGKNWQRLREIVHAYDAKDDIHTLVRIGIISKHAFVRSASVRFERLRGHYEDMVKCHDRDVDFMTLAEYVRLLQIDAFVLEKYDFVRTTIVDMREVFKLSFPRFLADEYILKPECYNLDKTDENGRKALFSEHSKAFRVYTPTSVRRFSRMVERPDPQEVYFNIEMDPVSRFFIRGIQRELATDKRRVDLSFSVKHAFDGLKACEFNV